MADLVLDPIDERRLAGEEGEAPPARHARPGGHGSCADAERFIDVDPAHVDACLYHGQVEPGLRRPPRVCRRPGDGPNHLNVGALDLLHPDRFRGERRGRRGRRRLMERYVGMGCRPTFTCAPYQLRRPARAGQHVAWAESNAIVFANSVLGRPDRPLRRLHRHLRCDHRPCAGRRAAPDEQRRGQVLFRLGPSRDRLVRSDALFPCSGTWSARRPGSAGAGRSTASRRGDRGPAQGPWRGRRLLRRGGALPRGRHHARGTDPRGGVRRWRAARTSRSTSIGSAAARDDSPRPPGRRSAR